ncbi:MFS transporter [Metallosphaera hakonensis]|uniref:MFS transporter n=1 Tax=Metallosphaera hakonensis JCM 8857 = DSM 7519 TaxID=1293036 RepID=A0A2U9ISG7_9CREN|nr:MFS transporter [Metallosphaera hakonensis]AWR98955.1 MFS transporter [Metallosphaera hakonensis JCM 8857 = DSM 7519]
MRKFLIVFITSASFFLSYFSRIAWSIVSVYSTLRPTQVEDSVIFSLFFLGYVVVQIPAGVVSNKFPRSVGLASLLGLSASSFISGMSTNIVEEYLASLLMGLSAGWIYPVTIKVLSASFSPRKLPVAIGYYSLAWPLSIVLSGLILPFICINISWRWAYYLVAIVSLLLALLYLPLNVKVEGNKSGGVFTLVRNRNVITISLSGFLFFLSYWIITLYAYKYFLDVGLNPYTAGFAYSLLALAGIPSTVIAGYIIKDIGVRSTLSLFESIYGALTIALAYFVISVQIMLIATIMGFVRFIITPANSSAVSLIDSKNAGSISGFANFFWQSSGVVAPIIASIAISALGFHMLWVICGLIILVSAISYFLLLRV